MKKYYYTLWKAHEGEDEAILLDDEPVYFFRLPAFKRAKFLANNLPSGSGFSILVRKVAFQDDNCVEWEFKPSVHS